MGQRIEVKSCINTHSNAPRGVEHFTSEYSRCLTFKPDKTQRLTPGLHLSHLDPKLSGSKKPV